MRRHTITAFSLVLSLFTSLSICAQESGKKTFSAANVYYESYIKQEDATKFEAEGKFLEANKALHTSLRLLMSIRSAHPDYEVEQIAYKINETKTLIKKIAPAVAKERAEKNLKRQDFAQTEEDLTLSIPRVDPTVTKARQRELDNLYQQIRELRVEYKLAVKERRQDRAKLRIALSQLEQERAKKANEPLLREIIRLKDTLKATEIERDTMARALSESRSKYDILRKENIELGQEKIISEKALKDISNRLTLERGTNNSVVKGLQKQKQALSDKLEKTENSLAASQKHIQRLDRQLAESRNIIGTLTKERDELLIERDRMSELLKMGEADRTRQLIDQTLSLGKQLRESQEIVKKLSLSDSTTKNQLSEARTKLEQAQIKMLRLVRVTSDQQKRIKDYEQRLEDTRLSLAEKTATGAAPGDVAILRSVIETTLRQQKRRQKSTQALIKHIKNLGLLDVNMNQLIQDATSGKLVLNSEQRALIARSNQSSEASIYGPGTVSPEIQERSERDLKRRLSTISKYAKKAYVSGRHKTAADMFSLALEEHPGHVDSLLNLGVVSLKLKDYPTAEGSFLNAITLEESSDFAHQMLGVTLFQQGKNEPARDYLIRSIELNNQSPKSHIFLGSIEAQQENYADAETHFQAAIKLDPRLSSSFYNMALLLERKGKLDEALNMYRLSLEKGAKANPNLEKRLLKNRPS